jgi:uncharacterized protein (TIGR00725 family)
MQRPLIVGVMGGANASVAELENAYQLGRLIAKQGWILLNGGRNTGVMEASARGAVDNGGLTIGILPDDTLERVSKYIQSPILTGMGNARNCINVLSSHGVVACPGGAGTISEIALALKIGRPVIIMDFDTKGLFESHRRKGLLFEVKTPQEVIQKLKALIGSAINPEHTLAAGKR